LTKKLHIGLPHNPRFLEGYIELKKTRLAQVKLEILSGVTLHLQALKYQWQGLREALKTKKLEDAIAVSRKENPEISDMVNCLQEESTYKFILRQHYARTLSET